MIIFNQSYDSTILKLLDKVPIKPGTDTNIVLSRYHVDKLSKPYSNCDIDLRNSDINSIDSKFYKQTFEKGVVYNQRECFRKAFRKTVTEKCNCMVEKIDIEIGLNFTLCPDLGQNAIKCSRKVATVDWVENFYGKYDKECPLECNYDWIQYSVAFQSYPSFPYANYLRNNAPIFKNANLNRPVTNEDVKKSCAAVRIYYERLGYFQTLEMASISSIALISSFGGTLGLFMGVSFISLIEIFIIIVRVFLAAFLMRK